jgi:cation:H+ antiporter
MATDLFLILLGLALLLVAADLLVRGAVEAAAALKISPLLISLTIVSFGASAPEMSIALRSALTGTGEIAVGNIIGSNIANIFLVLGLPALIHPISAQAPGLKPHALALAGATALFCATGYAIGALNAMTGVAFLTAITAYLGFMAHQQRRKGADPALHDTAHFEEPSPSAFKSILFIAAGLIGLPFGAHVVVDHASLLAEGAGVPSEIIAMTIIAFGASLPELATVATAAFRKKSDVAIGAVIGSNIFNILAAGGIAGIAGGGAFSEASRRLDMPAMLLGAAIVLVFVLARKDIGRPAGLAMTIGYAAFLAALWTVERSG